MLPAINGRSKKLAHDQTRRLTAMALRRGLIRKTPCVVCGSRRVQVHHVDYADPFNVKCLCFRHHYMAHGKRTKTPFPRYKRSVLADDHRHCFVCIHPTDETNLCVYAKWRCGGSSRV